MYIHVCVQERESYYASGPEGRTKVRLEQASGERCVIVPYQEFDMRVVRELSPRAIAMSGFGGHFQSRKVKWFLGMSEVLHDAHMPMICFCGSHQLLGFSFSRDLPKVKQLKDQPIRKLRLSEDLPRRAQNDPQYDLSPFFVADGFFPIRKIQEDPLFHGLQDPMIMRCSHYCEVKSLPHGFELLATSGHCRIEAMRHRERPLYGTQFHPEAYERPFFDGRKLLDNFADIVRSFWKNKREE